MLLREFYEKVGTNDEKAVLFLRTNVAYNYNLLPSDNDISPCHKCGPEMATISRKRNRGCDFRPVLRCRRKGCQATPRSVRSYTYRTCLYLLDDERF